MVDYENGQVPARLLVPISYDPEERLLASPARALDAMGRRAALDLGHRLVINDTYRSFAEQVAYRAKYGNGAAVPGFSNHGWAIAADISTGGKGYDSPEYKWIQKHGKAFGWHNPPRYAKGGAKPEPWHHEYLGLANDPSYRVVQFQSLLKGTGAGRRDYTGALDGLWGPGMDAGALRFYHRAIAHRARPRNIIELRRILGLPTTHSDTGINFRNAFRAFRNAYKYV